MDVDDGRLATGHDRRGRPTSHWHLAALAGAGGLRSTAADLLGFLRLHADRASSTPARPCRTRNPHGPGPRSDGCTSASAG